MHPSLREQKYTLLGKGDAGASFDDDEGPVDTSSVRHSAKTNPYSSLARNAYKLALMASLVVNVALAVTLYHAKGVQQTRSQSPEPLLQGPYQAGLQKTLYAGLEYNTNGTWEFETPFAQENITAADEEWMAVDISNAFVALTSEHASQLGLPRSLPFPWDKQRKELYLISSIHSMHCLTVLHRSNLEYRTNHTQTYTTEHILHCLDNLRVDLECSADDTPRFVPPHATESTAKTGVGQIRQCRDWTKLNEWAKEHDACFKYNQFLSQELSGNKVYPSAWQFCDKGSEYLPLIQQHYRKGSDWVAPFPDWPDIDEIQHRRPNK